MNAIRSAVSVGVLLLAVASTGAAPLWAQVAHPALSFGWVDTVSSSPLYPEMAVVPENPALLAWSFPVLSYGTLHVERDSVPPDPATQQILEGYAFGFGMPNNLSKKGGISYPAWGFAIEREVLASVTATVEYDASGTSLGYAREANPSLATGIGISSRQVRENAQTDKMTGFQFGAVFMVYPDVFVGVVVAEDRRNSTGGASEFKSKRQEKKLGLAWGNQSRMIREVSTPKAGSSLFHVEVYGIQREPHVDGTGAMVDAQSEQHLVMEIERGWFLASADVGRFEVDQRGGTFSTFNVGIGFSRYFHVSTYVSETERDTAAGTRESINTAGTWANLFFSF